jgi:hypothetical protein
MRTVKGRLEYGLNLLDELQVFGDRDIEIARAIEEIIASCIDDLERAEIIRKQNLLESE